MKIAYYINENGEKSEIKANNELCQKYILGLFCPCCGEKVIHINGKKQEKHFRHYHGSFSQECENYCTSISHETAMYPYEREGLQLYLIKELGRFYLNLGLYGLEGNTIKEAEKINLEIQIDIEKDYIVNKKVNSKDFIPRMMEFIKINIVKQKYNLSFNTTSVPIEIRTKWTRYINGIGSNGAIFNYGENGGKKISSAVGLKANEEYLLFTKIDMNKQYIKGISYELIQEVNFGWIDNYRIYKIIIGEVNAETLLFCERFGFTLGYSKPKIVPIWPPCVVMEQELVYQYDGKKYFTINSEDGIARNVYSHSLQKKLNYELIKAEKSLINTCLKTKDFLSLGNLKNQFAYSVIKKSLDNIDIEPDIKFGDLQKKLTIDTKSKVIVNVYYKQVLTKSKLIKRESIIEIEYKKHERLEVLYGLDVIWSTGEKENDEIKSEISCLDNQLLREIYLCRGEIVDIPNSFKWMVLKRKKYSRSFKELQKILKGKKVYIELINLLKKY